MDLGLADKTVVLTGASGGIGRALARGFGLEGARLVLQGRHGLESLEEWVAEQPWRDRALCLAADVARPDDVARLFRVGAERFERVDVTIACAGVWPKEAELLHEATEARIRATIETNLLGSLWTARAFMEHLADVGPRRDEQGPCLLFIGSTAGQVGEREHADYATAKAGLIGLAKSLKNEIARLDPYGRVNVIQPGWTVTHMVREELEQPGVVAQVTRTMALRQLARADDIARAALFLASPLAARHVSGEVLTVAGGMEGRVLWGADEIDEARVRRRLGEP
jgi:3-oxoacyl-[acyl-carrier protein] reductase